MEKQNTKSLTIIPPVGYDIDKENSTFENIVFKKIESKYPKDWAEAFIGKHIEGFWIDMDNEIVHIDGPAILTEIDVFKTKKQAESALAYAQLTQLMALPCYNGNWEADWTNGSLKWVIRRDRNIIEKIDFHGMFHPIAFKSKEACDAFLENHQELLKQYFQL